MALAFQAGLLNIGGFIAFQRFVSHITGFATLFGYEVGHQNFHHALGLLLVPCFFLCGAIISGKLVDLRLKLNKDPKYYTVFGVMFVLLLIIVVGGFNGLFGKFGDPLEQSENYILLALLCLVCGIQNGTITTISKNVIRTTHLTGITTDLGIGIVRVLNRKKLKAKNIDTTEDMRANFMRIGIIAFFGLGSVAGSILFMNLNYRGFLVPVFISGSLFSLMFYFQVIKRKLPKGA